MKVKQWGCDFVTTGKVPGRFWESWGNHLANVTLVSDDGGKMKDEGKLDFTNVTFVWDDNKEVGIKESWDEGRIGWNIDLANVTLVSDDGGKIGMKES